MCSLPESCSHINELLSSEREIQALKNELDSADIERRTCASKMDFLKRQPPVSMSLQDLQKAGLQNAASYLRANNLSLEFKRGQDARPTSALFTAARQRVDRALLPLAVQGELGSFLLNSLAQQKLDAEAARKAGWHTADMVHPCFIFRSEVGDEVNNLPDDGISEILPPFDAGGSRVLFLVKLKARSNLWYQLRDADTRVSLTRALCRTVKSVAGLTDSFFFRYVARNVRADSTQPRSAGKIALEKALLRTGLFEEKSHEPLTVVPKDSHGCFCFFYNDKAAGAQAARVLRQCLRREQPNDINLEVKPLQARDASRKHHRPVRSASQRKDGHARPPSGLQAPAKAPMADSRVAHLDLDELLSGSTVPEAAKALVVSLDNSRESPAVDSSIVLSPRVRVVDLVSICRDVSMPVLRWFLRQPVGLVAANVPCEMVESLIVQRCPDYQLRRLATPSLTTDNSLVWRKRFADAFGKLDLLCYPPLIGRDV